MLEQRYHRWRDANPNAMALFERFARQAVKAGEPIGVKALVERVRWEVKIHTQSADGFKLNNSHTAYLARDLAARVPGLKALIETRKVKEEW